MVDLVLCRGYAPQISIWGDKSEDIEIGFQENICKSIAGVNELIVMLQSIFYKLVAYWIRDNYRGYRGGRYEQL